VYKPLPPDDPKQRQADITLAKKALQWESTTPLEKGLRKTIQYFKELRKEQAR
jgi:nucleoside-diphosphate-sugar epimerase